VPLDVICSQYECPPFKAMNSSGCGYETRMVYGAKWVATDLDISDFKLSAQLGFWKLLKYISGHNSASQKMDMTVPVLFKWFLDEDYNMTAARMHFYLPAEFQTNPPEPSDPSVQIDDMEDALLYSRAFGGMAADDKYFKEADRLGRALEKAGKTPYLGFTMTAEFTRPGIFQAQRHEVLFLDGGEE